MGVPHNLALIDHQCGFEDELENNDYTRVYRPGQANTIPWVRIYISAVTFCQAGPISAVGSASRLVFGSSQVRFPGLAHCFTTVILVTGEIMTKLNALLM